MKIIYVSESGNTKQIAELIGKGIELAGKEAEVIEASTICADEIIKEDLIAFGSPACGVETIEEYTMEPLIDSLKGKLKDKKIALFGSYGWGDGEWIRNWEDKMKSLGSIIVQDSLAILEDPTERKEECIEFGKKLAQ